MNFESSWADAEQIVYGHLLTATNSQDRKQAFRGYLPAMVNIWMLNTGGSGNNEQTVWTPDIRSIHVPALIVGQFGARERALEFGMQVVKALPIENVENVQVFRIALGGFPEIKPDVVAAGNEEQKFLVHAVTIRCELVFSTGGRLAG